MTPHCSPFLFFSSLRCSFSASSSATSWCRERTAHWLHTVVELHLTQAQWLRYAFVRALIRNKLARALRFWATLTFSCTLRSTSANHWTFRSKFFFLFVVITNQTGDSQRFEINACCQVYLVAIHRVITLLHHYGYLWLKELKLQCFDMKSKKRTSCQCGNCRVQSKTAQTIYNISLSCVQQIKCFTIDSLIILFVWLWVTII